MNRKLLCCALAFAWIAGCGGGSNNNNNTTPASITATTGSGQSANISTAFASPLAATVLNSSGSPVSGVTVTFAAPSSGASGTFAGGANTATTNSSGVATSAAFTANATAGAYSVTASVSGVSTPASFSLTNNAPAPASVSATSGTPQTAEIGAAFAAPLAVTVLDSNSNPVAGVTVTFAAPASGASGTFASSANTATTNATGVATSAVFTANSTTGAYSVTASVSGVTTPASFSLTNAGAPAAIAATSGSGQSAPFNTAFGAPLAATVTDSNNIPIPGIVVTFTAPSTTTAATGTFAGSVNTATTNASGVAISPVFTANAYVGPYTVTASTTGVATSASFSLTNNGVNYTYYGSGLDQDSRYSVVGSVTLDGNGNVLGGEQDYNDGGSITDVQDPIVPVAGTTVLAVDPTTGQGTLTIQLTNNGSSTPAPGVNGLETFAVQFVNAKHALLTQFDGTAMSIGAMDFQTPSTQVTGGGYAFTLSGWNGNGYAAIAGGVLTVSSDGTTISNGVLDSNDDENGLNPGETLTGTIATSQSPDAYGRGTMAITTTPQGQTTGTTTNFAYYIVGPEVLRIIETDSYPMLAGSAFGQGTAANNFSNQSFGPVGSSSVFALNSNTWSGLYQAVGTFTVTPDTNDTTGGTFSGIADQNGLDMPVISAQTITGSYSLPTTSGYGTWILNSNLGPITELGIYLTDPKLNLNDPNNTVSGLGGAVFAELDNSFGTGTIAPQTDTTASFGGNYAFGAQSVANNWYYYFVGQGAVSAQPSNPGVLTLAGIGLASDISTYALDSSAADSDVAYTGTVTPDPTNTGVGRYTMSYTVTPNGGTAYGPVNNVVYQAYAGQLFWINEDDCDYNGSNCNATFGVFEQQPAAGLSPIPAPEVTKAKPAVAPAIKRTK